MGIDTPVQSCLLIRQDFKRTLFGDMLFWTQSPFHELFLTKVKDKGKVRHVVQMKSAASECMCISRQESERACVGNVTNMCHGMFFFTIALNSIRLNARIAGDQHIRESWLLKKAL